ncbi:hypothetical protein J9317_12290 [Metabacillus sp. KIGAM252]|uniref:Uncharacterized protein n=1 Tax=Metabacillus flavus TaxID=2823519 RepID=A0ABS5LGQ2_9BACI|nr:DUF6376 family protein [Metabacillus flavus]MBS2969544.1 hypothetical protein [Metabacillus flavus]
MMRLMTLLIISMLFLYGCSVSSKPATYGEEAANFAYELSATSEQISTLFYDAADSETARTELETILISMKNQITAFNKTQAPEQMSEWHRELVEQNRHALQNIDDYLTAIENNTYTDNLKTDPGLPRQVNVIQSIAKNIENDEKK